MISIDEARLVVEVMEHSGLESTYVRGTLFTKEMSGYYTARSQTGLLYRDLGGTWRTEEGEVLYPSKG